MSPQAKFEAWVRSQLTAIAEPLEALPDPYGRLLRRRRSSWLRRGLLAGVAALAAVATGTFVALSPADSPPPPDGALRWVDALVDGPPRGAVAADPAFRLDMQGRLTQIIRSGAHHDALRAVDDEFHPEQLVRLVFADDIDDRRIAIVALRLPSPASDELGRTRLVWVSGPRGANPDRLESVFDLGEFPDVDSRVARAAPFAIAQIGVPPSPTTWVGLAPPGCTVSSAAAAQPEDWRPEPTGSYVVRTMATFRAERWRVTCDGVVREERAAPWREDFGGDDPDELLNPAMADLIAAGWSAERARFGAFGGYSIVKPFRPYLAAAPRLLYAGSPAELDGVDVAVITAPTVYPAWVASVTTVEGAGDTISSSGYPIRLEADPFAAGATLAAVIHPSSGPKVLALLTPAAVTAELLGLAGTSLATATVVDRVTVFTVAAGTVAEGAAYERLTVVAYDAAGTQVSTSRPATPNDSFPVISEWD